MYLVSHALLDSVGFPIAISLGRQHLRKPAALAAHSAHGTDVHHARRVLFTAGRAADDEPRNITCHLRAVALVRLSAARPPGHHAPHPRRCLPRIVAPGAVARTA